MNLCTARFLKHTEQWSRELDREDETIVVYIAGADPLGDERFAEKEKPLGFLAAMAKTTSQGAEDFHLDPPLATQHSLFFLICI